jgi:recombination protein RecT
MATQDQLHNQLTEKKEPTNFPAMLKAFLPEIQRALPKHLNGDRMARIALTAFRRNPQLANCDPRSVFAAVIQAAQLGLEPDTLGRAYLIPYKGECTFVPGWKGLVDLVNRSGAGSCWTGAVFEGDQFDYGLGDTPFIKHKPGDEDDPTKLTHVYAVGRVKGAEWPIIEVWTVSKCAKHLKRYNKVGARHYAHENWEMYCRKVALLQVIKYMPASPELVATLALNDAAELGNQNLSVKDAIEGTWAPAPEETGTPEAPAAAGKTEAAASGAQKPAGKGKAITFAVVADQIERAGKDVDLLAAAADLIGEVPDPQQRAELTDLYRTRLGEAQA